MTTSLEQYNDHHQAWLDRHNVNKAFEEWASENYAYKNNTFTPGTVTAIVRTAKAFALFFAERVKGAPIATKPQSQAKQCTHCGRPHYPHHSEAQRKDLFCCAACEQGY